MADPEPIDSILKKIKKKWEMDKENWSVLSNVDRDGNREMLISQAPNSYWLKMKKVSALNSMAYGKEVTNLDDEINQKIYSDSPKTCQSKEDIFQLFGMMVPKKKEMLYTSGIERYSPQMFQDQKEKIEEKETVADREFRKYLRNKWLKEHPQRDGMYL